MIREATLSDLDRCFEIEHLSYDGDEAANKDKIKRRIEQYPQGFIVLETEGTVMGFINSGATDHVEMSDDAIKEMIGHNPSGSKIVIMSVVVHPGVQGKGYGKQLMESFITRMQSFGKSSIHLMCQKIYVPFYEQFGFQLHGASQSEHGGLQWFEMSLTLPKTDVALDILAPI
jgi:ribosomal protein S18 acetylase RimI-like enzyme